MSGQPTPRSIFELAIDSALVRHVSALFDKYASDIEAELAGKTGSAPGSRERFDRKLDIAIFTHSEMLDMMRSKKS